MSSSDDDGDQSSQGGAGRREVAWRLFAAEYDDADFDYSESDEERAPNYVVTPTGARVNRLFVVGVLTEVEQVSDDVLRGRVVDPTGAFVLYAGQYQPDEMAFLESADPPAFVAVTGKARTFQPEDSDRVFTSIRPESINRVDAETRDRWTVQTAEQTLARVSAFADAVDSGRRGDDLREALEAGGADAGLAAGIPLALDHYGTTKAYLAEVWDLAVDAARVVAGELDADDVGPLELAPGDGGDEVGIDLDYALTDAETGDLAELETEATAAGTTSAESDAESEPATGAETGTDVEADAEAVVDAGTDDAGTDDAGTDDAGSAVDVTADDAAATSDDLGEAPTSTMDQSEDETEPAEAETETGTADVEPEAAEAEAEAAAESEDAPEVEDAEEAAEFQEEIGTDEPPTVEDEQETSTDESFSPEEEEGPDIGTAGAGDEMYEFDDEEREQVEEEYGLEFSSGTEVESPGESEMEPPEPDPGEGPDEGTPEREAELAEDEPNAGEPADPTAEEVDTDELQDVESASGGTEAVVNDADEAPAGGSTASAEAPGASIGEDEVAEADEETGDAGEQETPENLEDTVMDEMRELNEGDGVERETLMASVVQSYDVTPADVEDALEAALMAGRCYESGEDTLKPI